MAQELISSAYSAYAAVGKGFCIGGEAEERAESSVAGFAAVECLRRRRTVA